MTGRGSLLGSSGVAGRMSAFVAIGLLAATSAGLILWATAKGPGISPDSVTYAFAARSFDSSGRLSFVAGGSLTVFPPGLPVVLGAFAHVGVPVQTTGVAISALGVVALVVMTFLLSEVAVETRVASVLAAGIVGLSVATLAVYSMLWTEPLFNALELGVLLVLARAARNRVLSLRAALAVAVCTSVATTVRDVALPSSLRLQLQS